jgi:hypothetical protein
VRSLPHLLNVFATRLEIDHGPKDAVKAIKLFAQDRTIRAAEHRNWNENEERRVAQQRTLFAMLPSCNATDRLKAAMLQRAYDLLWDGDALGCDALIEFLPSKDVDKMMACWSDDFEGSEPRSEFYKGKT